MKKSKFCALSAAAVIGLALTSTAASAAVMSPAQPSNSVPTTVTFTVGSGLLTITAPDAVSLGTATGTTDTGLPGSTVHGTMGDTVVTDNRALLDATWTATALSTTFTTGTSTPDEIIPVGAASYDPGTITETAGNFLSAPVGTPITLSGAPQTVVAANADGDNVATWDAALAVAIPSTAVLGLYTGTLTQSVS
jgi:hypothetical protein